MGYGAQKPRQKAVVARGSRNMREDANLATRIADFQVDIVLLYLRAAFISVQNCASGDGRDAARTRAHQG
jgi:hypothetical protein